MNCEEYLARAPSLRPIARQEEAVWINPRLVPYDVTKGVSELVVSDADIADAAASTATMCTRSLSSRRPAPPSSSAWRRRRSKA